MTRELRSTLLRTALPILLGVAVAVWLFRRDIDTTTLSQISFDFHTVSALLLAMLFVIGRDFGLTWRFHTLASGDLSWRRALRTDIMCAFTSATTPSVVGGSALAIFYLNREGIKLGRATALTLTTLFLDELFFVVFCPIILLLLPWDALFGVPCADDGGEEMFLGGIKLVFWLVYAGIVAWTAILYMAILGRPDATARILHRVAQWRLLRRWQKHIDSTADNMASTAQWVRGRGWRWWAQVFGGTIVSWFSRYFVVNALFVAFVPSASGLLVFARQFVVWVVLMVSPTPGGSGISEWLFANYYGDIIGAAGIATVLALVWRLFSYYVYLIAGAMLLPSYFGKNSTNQNT